MSCNLSDNYIHLITGLPHVHISLICLVQLFPWAVEYAGNALVVAAAEACRYAAVPIALHLDHCQSPKLVRRTASIPGGFDGIMCDMSHY
jgi:fructose-bisphosphate aldolase, class II